MGADSAQQRVRTCLAAQTAIGIRAPAPATDHLRMNDHDQSSVYTVRVMLDCLIGAIRGSSWVQ